MPKVSIIIPVYNVEKYLDRCMNSVLNQTLKDIEIILVDDGSTDHCPQMCDAYAEKDSRIKVIHKKNAGLGMARNTGLDYVTGEYVTFIDSDDYISEKTCEICYHNITENLADVCIHGFVNVNEKGEEFPKVNPLKHSVIQGEEVIDTVLLGMIAAKEDYYKDTYIGMSVCICLYLRELIEQHHVRFCSEREYISEDLIFQMTMIPYAKKVVTIEDTLYYYCENGNNASLTKKYAPDKFQRYKKLYNRQLEMLCEMNRLEEGKKRAARMFLGNIRVCMKQISSNSQIDKKDKKKYMNEICRDSCVKDIISWYDWKRNPWKQRISTFMIKHHMVSLLLLAAKT